MNELATMEDFKLVTVNNKADDGRREQMLEEMEDLGSDAVSDSMIRKIKMPTAGGSAYQIEGDDETDPDLAKTFDCVILFSHLMNARWDTSFTGENTAPACVSVDAKTGHDYASGETRACGTCAYNQFGSGGSGRKACKNMRRVYLMLSGSPWLYTFSVPPTSVKDVTRQFARISAAAGLPLSQIVVRFGLAKGNTRDRSGVTKVTVTPVGRLSPATCEATKSARAQVKAQYADIEVSTDEFSGAERPASIPQAQTVEPQIRENDDGFIDVPETVQEELPFV